jgi:hypothetical protein
MPHSTSKSIFLAPVPRIVSDIFDEKDLLRLRTLGDVVIQSRIHGFALRPGWLVSLTRLARRASAAPL